MPIDNTQYQTWLDEALTAQQALLTGKQAVEVSGPAGTIKFTAGSPDRLAAHIANLRNQLSTGVAGGVARPIRFGF